MSANSLSDRGTRAPRLSGSVKQPLSVSARSSSRYSGVQDPGRSQLRRQHRYSHALWGRHLHLGHLRLWILGHADIPDLRVRQWRLGLHRLLCW